MTTTETNTATTFIVMTASARMPSFCWGQYRRVAVVEVTQGSAPRMISSRARGVIRIVKTWEKCNVGTTAVCAYERARAEAKDLAMRLNAGVA